MLKDNRLKKIDYRLKDNKLIYFSIFTIYKQLIINPLCEIEEI
ncbi:MAG: hypothetical protein TRG1_3135 [Flavobacteriaceae bacterium FS1-H7996/R]|nr:MAG: hypothetical protein TRG1_3135 [Flavobacteriaceae bacterium FS1-H7996/R]